MASAEGNSEGVKPAMGILSRMSAKPGDSKPAGNPAGKKEESAGKPKRGMLSRISAKIGEQKTAAPTDGSAEARDDPSNKPKRNMLSRISLTGKGGEGRGSLPTAEEPSVRGGMRGMLSRISAKPGTSDNAPSPAASSMEDVSVLGRRGMLARISGRPEEPRKSLDGRKSSKDCDDEHDVKEGRVLDVSKSGSQVRKAFVNPCQVLEPGCLILPSHMSKYWPMPVMPILPANLDTTCMISMFCQEA